MKKSTKIALSLVVGTLLLNGCSSSSSDGETETVVPTKTVPAVPTDVTVERGAVYDATVTDAKGQIAESNNTNGYSNVYTFPDTPKYPISVNGGWIDVDGDGKMDKNQDDILLDFTMQSYSNIVTPITTYIADPSKEKRDEKLKDLQSKINANGENVTLDDLLKLPSKSSQYPMYMHNAIYKSIENNTTDITDINTNYFSIIVANINENNVSNITVEKKIVSKLKEEGKVQYLDANYLDAHGQLPTVPAN